MKPYKIVVFTLSCSKDYYSCNCCVMNQFLFFFFFILNLPLFLFILQEKLNNCEHLYGATTVSLYF